SGPLTVSSGLLAVTELNNAGSGQITLGGGGLAVLRFIGSNDSTDRAINLAGDATVQASGTSTSDNLLLSGPITGNGYNLTLGGTNSRQGGEIATSMNLSGGSLIKA